MPGVPVMMLYHRHPACAGCSLRTVRRRAEQRLDGGTLTGSGTLTGPDGSQRTVSFVTTRLMTQGVE